MKPRVAPPRLIDGQGSLSSLLREAAHEYRQNLHVHGALLHQLERARERPRAPRHALLLGLAAGLALVFGVLFGHFRAPSPDLIARAEPELGRSRPQREPAPVAPAVPSATRSQSSSEWPAKSAPARAALPSHATADMAPSASVAPPPPLRPANDAAVSAAVGASADATSPNAPSANCLAFARAGDAPKAEQCFEEQAAGQNLSAEVALYELARLRRDMLGKPAAALSALEDYTRRFPHGSLNGEVLFSRLELLVKLGRPADVLRASDDLLASASGKERALEIHFLRGNVYARALKDPASAAREYAQAESAVGRVGDDAAFLGAVNLENAGDVARASAAYERYLSRASARHHAEAQARLGALRAGAPSAQP